LFVCFASFFFFVARVINEIFYPKCKRRQLTKETFDERGERYSPQKGTQYANSERVSLWYRVFGELYHGSWGEVTCPRSYNYLVPMCGIC
jgi:hypothetical protein